MEQYVAKICGYDVKDSVARAAINETNNTISSEVIRIEKGKYYVTPEMYGAVGDGVTDDTMAIKNALESGASVVNFGKNRVYNVTGIKANMQNLTINGNGSKLNLINVNSLVSSGNSYVITNYTDGYIATGEFHNGYIIINDLEIDANADEVTQVTVNKVSPCCLAGSWLFDYEKVILNNVYVHHSFNGCGIFMFNCNEVEVINCKATNIGYAQEHFYNFVEFPNYEWDAICGSVREIEKKTLKRFVVRDCVFDDIAGCSSCAQYYEYFAFEGCTVTNDRGYMIEDNTTINMNATRIIANNRIDKASYLYGNSNHLAENTKVNLIIENNIVTNFFGDKDNEYTNGGALILLYSDSSPLVGEVDTVFRNNYIEFDRGVENRTNFPSATCYGLNIMIRGKLEVENCTFIQKSGDDKIEQIISRIMPCIYNVVIRNCEVQSKTASCCLEISTANYDTNKQIVNIENCRFNNTVGWSTIAVYNMAIRNSSGTGVLKVKDCYSNVGGLVCCLSKLDELRLGDNRSNKGIVTIYPADVAPEMAWVYNNIVENDTTLGITGLENKRFLTNNIVTSA